MIVENNPLQVVPYSEYVRLKEVEELDFDPKEKITVFVVTRVIAAPGFDKDRYYSTMSRIEAEQVSASLKPGIVELGEGNKIVSEKPGIIIELREGNKIPYHWEIEEMTMTAGVYSEFHFAFNSCLRWRATLTKYPDGSVIGSRLIPF
jgi:hypothetical protein